MSLQILALRVCESRQDSTLWIVLLCSALENRNVYIGSNVELVASIG
jgi:hypothetical protein